MSCRGYKGTVYAYTRSLLGARGQLPRAACRRNQLPWAVGLVAPQIRIVWRGASLEKCLVNAFLSLFYVTLSETRQQVQQSKGVARDRALHLLQKDGYFSISMHVTC